MLTAYKNVVWRVINLVNASRGRTFDQQRNKLLLKTDQGQHFITIARQIVANRFALASLGELSFRLSSNHLAITAQQSQLSRLAETDIVTYPIESDKAQGAPPPHLAWHRLIYRQTQAQAVLFGQPPYAMTLAAAAQLPEQKLLPAIGQIIGGVTLLPAAEFSPAALAAAVQEQHVVLAPQTGALIWGNSLEDVLTRTEALEYISQMTVIARQSNLMPASS